MNIKIEEVVNYPSLSQGASRTLPSPRAVSRRLVPNQGKIALSKKVIPQKESFVKRAIHPHPYGWRSSCQEVINTVVCEDALSALKTFPDESVDCVITSPPYY